MKKNLFLAALAIVALASCTDSEFVGDNSPDNNPTANEKAIVFNSGAKTVTRADHYGKAAADKLNNWFVVGGFKGTGTSSNPAATPTPVVGAPATDMVFDHYQVKWSENTAGTTESNTSNWEYVSYTAMRPSTLHGNTQSIKYWDYSADQYDFIAYSASNADTITTGSVTDNKLLMSAINATTASTNAYTLQGNTSALEKCYIADMVTAYKTGASMTPAQPKYQDEVIFTFRPLVSKVRVALYETIPGYSVKNVTFYTNNTAYLTSTTEGDKVSNATLFTTGGSGEENVKNYFFTAGTCQVYFPTIGNTNIGNSDYNKAHVKFTPTTKQTTMGFDALNYVGAEYKEKTAGSIWLGRTSNTASFAGAVADNYYKIALPNEDGTVLELRVDYELESLDGSGEVIHVYGATAYVPAIYAAWKSGYAYTYIFKISDNTNGWTHKVDAATGSDPAGLYPITFDAVVAETQDYTQSTITTVATPSITTYQKGHDYTANEYNAAKGAIYVQVMDNAATLKSDLNEKGKLYEVASTNALDLDGVVSEAEIMDALNIVTVGGTTPINGWTLTDKTSELITYPTAIPGADGNDITVVENTAAKFTPTAGKVYAYVYTVSTGTATTVGIANTYATAPDDWITVGTYFTDKACTTAAPTTFAPGVYYKKAYIDNKNVYGVKLIRIKA